MDKNMIHIDDLIRQRMSGAEEAERPGAWLGMKDLLDKQLPVETVASAYNWRRLLGYGAALLLLASVSLGGYKLYESASTAPATTAHYANPGASSEHRLPGGNAVVSAPSATISSITDNTNPALPATAPSANRHTATASNTNNSSTSASAAHRPSAGSSVAAAPLTSHPAGSRSASHVPGTSSATGNTPASANRSAHSADHTGNVASLNPVPGNTSSDQLIASQPADRGAITGPAVREGVTALGQLSVKDQALRVAAGTVRPQMNTISLPVADQHTAAADVHELNAGTGTPVTRTSVPRLAANNTARNNKPALTLRQDTVQRLEMVQHRKINPLTRKAVNDLDTISSSYTLIDRQEPVLPDTAPALDNLRRESRMQVLAHNGEAKPAAAVPAAASSANAEPGAPSSAAEAADNNLVSLSKFRVASTKFQLWNPERYDEMVRNFKFNLARVQLYAGITGGFNAALFTPNATIGFQLGLTGMMVLNERWSMMAELKYLQRFNTGNPVQDDYKRIVPGSITIEDINVNGVPSRKYTWVEDQIDHHYNFSTIQSVELPLSVRYHFGRFFAEAGGNLKYGFGINVEEVEINRHLPVTQTAVYPVSMGYQTVSSGAPRVKLDDFGSRIGIGYLMGLGFECSPALNVNLRMTQAIWDNATTYGAQKVSKNLYRAPSVQVSIGYRFSQNAGR